MINFLQQYTTLTASEITFLEEKIPVKTFSKGDILLHQGSICRNVYFIQKGIVRLYYQADHEEKTAFFYQENEFVSSFESFVKQKPADHFLQCVEATTVNIISAENYQAILENFPNFEFLARAVMEEELIVMQNIISSFFTLNAEQRYLKLQKEDPNLLQRIPQYQLASYLGIQPESLSRLRKRLSEKSIS
ncbi:MAG: Crp/Fnr family transcriptional regulator [Calditrichota bacterium]